MDAKQESDSEWTTEEEESEYSVDSSDEEDEPLKPGYVWAVGLQRVGPHGVRVVTRQVPAHGLMFGEHDSSSSSEDDSELEDVDDEDEFDKDEEAAAEKKVDSKTGGTGSQEGGDGDKAGASGSQEGGGDGDIATAFSGLNLKTKLAPMMAECKTGDFVSLQKVAGDVRSFLTEDKEGLGELLKTKEFLPFLKDSLAAKPGFPSLRRDISWILEIMIMAEDKEKTIAKKMQDIDVAAKLLGFLKSSNNEVREQAARTLGLLTVHSSSKVMPLAMEVLELLKKLMTSPELTENMKRYISNIIWGLHMSKQITAVCRQSQAEMRANFPPLSVVKKSLPMVSALLDSDIEKIREQMLQVMCIGTVVLDKLNAFIKNGLAAKLVAFLPRREPPCQGVSTALGTIAAKGRRELLRFLQALDGSEGLREFWKCLVYDEDGLKGKFVCFDGSNSPSSSIEGVTSFIYGVNRYVFEDTERGGDDLTFTNAVIKSGHAHALAACMKNSDCAKKFREAAALHLGNLTSSINLPNSQKEVIAEMEILPQAIEFLKSKKQIAVIGSAAVIATLVQNNAERRDLVVELGAIEQLVNIFKNPPANFEDRKHWHNCLKPIEYIMKTEPLISLEAVKNVPNVLAVSFGSNEDSVLEVSLEILEQLLRYGTPAIELILGTSGLVKKMTDYKKYAEDPDFQKKAAELILRICQGGSSEQRRALVEQGLGDQFKNFLHSLSKEARKKTLECLLLIVNESKSAIPKSTLRQLKTVIQREVKKGNSETLELAQAVHQKIQA